MRIRTFVLLGVAVAATVCRSAAVDPPMNRLPPLEEIPRLEAGQIRDPAWRFKFVRVRGTLQDVFRDELDESYAFGLLFIDKMPIYVAFKDVPIERLQTFVGAELDLVAYADRFVPKDGRRILGMRLGVSGRWNAIRVIRPAPANPFDVPDLGDARSFNPDELPTLGRRKVTGEVLAVWGGNMALLRRGDNGSCLSVSFRDGRLPSVGETVEAVGLPEFDYFRINLVRAIWRPAVPKASVRTAEEELKLESESADLGSQPASYGRLVRLHGRVIGVPGPQEAQRRVIVESSGRKVSVDVSALPSLLEGLEAGCAVEVCGRIVLDVSISNAAIPFAHVQGFFVVPRTVGDFVVTARPPWWTAGRLLVVILVLLAAVVAVLIWNRALGLVAERRGRELYRRRLEGAKDAIKALERTRLSVELHDSLAQTLAGVSMEIEAAQQFAAGADGQLVRHLSIAERVLDSSRRELKNCLWDLRSDAIGETDMNAAVRKTLLPHSRNVTLDVRFNVPCGRLETNLAYDVLRVVRELSLNAIRHGGARRLEIAGCVDGGRLLFSVKDDGAGFDPDEAPGVLQGHFGIRGVRERLKGHGGTLVYERLERGMYARVSLALETNGAELEVEG